MADDNLMGQDEIEQLLNSGPSGGGKKDPPEAQPPPAAESSTAPAEQAADSSGDAPQITETELAEAVGDVSPAKTVSAVAEDDDKLLGQDDIEKLLNQAKGDELVTKKLAPTPKKVTPLESMPADGAMPQGDVEYLLNQAERALESISSGGEDGLPHGVASFRLEEFSGTPASTENATLDLVRDVELDLKIELGRTHMYLEDVLKLRKGSVVPLDKLAGDPVDVFVNGRLVARGEVLVLNDNFCVRVAELIAGTNVFS